MTDVPDKTTLNNNLGAACYRCRGFRQMTLFNIYIR